MLKRFLTGLVLMLLAVLGILESKAPAKTVLTSSKGVLRLHVIAASDSDEDQSAKLAVRDAILPLFERAQSYSDARAFLLMHGQEIQTAAETALRERGLDEKVQLSLGRETFPDPFTATCCFPRANTTRCVCASAPPPGITGGACCSRRCASSAIPASRSTSMKSRPKAGS